MKQIFFLLFMLAYSLGIAQSTHTVDFEPAGVGADWEWTIDQNADNPPLEFVANPSSDGVNSTATTAKFTARQSGQPWALCFTDDDGEFTFDATNSTVKIKVYKPVISNVAIKFEGLSPAIEIQVPNTVTDQWEELTFDFSGSIGNTYSRIVIIPDFEARTEDRVIYFDELQVPDGEVSGPLPEPTTAPDVPTQAGEDVISIYSEAYSNVPGTNFDPNWGQSTDVTVDYDAAGNNTLLYEGLNYQGTEFTNQNVSAYEYLHVDFWTPNSTTLDFYLISPGNELGYTLPIALETWVSVDIPLEYFDPPVDLNDVFQFKVVGNGTVYFDNWYFWKEPAAPGGDATLSDLQVDGTTIEGFNPNVFNYEVELPYGTTTVPTVTAETNDPDASYVINNAAQVPGTTEVVVTAEDGTTTENYSIEFVLEDPVPSAGAPAPTHDEVNNNVFSIYSDAYTNLENTNFNPFWGQSTIVTVDLDVDGDNTLLYENLNYQGTNLGSAGGTPQDVSNHDFLHIDFWTPHDAALNFFLISQTTGETFYTLPAESEQWVSIDIPLEHFSDQGINLGDIWQFKVDGGDGSTTVYFDNWYFWKEEVFATLDDLQIDGSTVDGFAPDIFSYDIELPAGTTTVPTVTATPTDPNATVVINEAAELPGTTEVVVTSEDESETETYNINFTVADPVPMASAPNPFLNEEDYNVVSIFSDSYTNLENTNFNPVWGQSTIVTEDYEIEGNQTLRYENLNFQGTNLGSAGATPQDFSGQDYLHIDFWTPHNTPLNFYLISQSSGEAAYALPSVTEEWVSINIPLSYFENQGLDLTDIWQFKVDGGDGTTTIYFDNWYFWENAAEPVLQIDPESMELTDVPLDCWHEGGTFKVYVLGGVLDTIYNVTLSDENDVYTLTHDYEFPLAITTDTLEFDIQLESEETGTFEAALLVTDVVTTRINSITGSTYEAQTGDVICDPIIATFDGTGHFDDNNSVGDPMRDNYHVVEGYNDVVYKFSYANDFILDVMVTENTPNRDGGLDPHMELFAAEDVATQNPDELEPIATGMNEILDEELWAGTYYLVLAGDQNSAAEYSLSIDAEDMPAPGAVTLLTPADGANETPVDPTLTWELGEYTENIDVYVDTQYPPQDKVLGNGVPVETIDVEGLSPAQIYFWKVVAHNSNGSTESETWAFTTTLPAPLYVQGTVFDFENVHLTWNNPYDATFKVTEDFENGELPEGWTMTTNATGSSAGWFITDNGGSGAFDIPDHTIYAVSNDDANDGDGSEDYLIMPPQDFAQWEGASLTFESFFNGDYSQSAYVEVSTDGGDTFELVHELEPVDGWTSVTVDLNDYVVSGNTEVLVAFHSDDNGAWASGWAVDNVELAFEGALDGGSRALIGYNVYQNGSQINDEMLTVEEYDVLELAAGDYVFGVSAVYDEGESAITEIETITILGIGGIEGTVTDADSGDGIEGANLTITGMWNDDELTYSATTDADGMYSVETPVLADGNTYTVEVSASGYADDMEEEVVVAPEAYTAVDFVLGDIPLPVTSVVAVQNENETEATITWEAPGEGGELVELSQHDNSPENGYFQSFDMGYGVVYDLTEYTDAMLEYVDFHHASWGVTGTWEYKIHVVNWDTYEEIAVLGPYETTGNDIWETEVDLGTITGLGGNQVGIFMEPMGNAADDAYPDLSSDDSGPDGMSVFGTIGDYENFETSTIGDFLMDLWITTAFGDAPVMANKVVAPTGNHQAEPRIASQAIPGEYITVNQKARTVSNDRVLQNYEVWRMMEGDEGTPADWTLLADDVTGTEYVDTEWADLEMGVYKYAVKAIYTITESEAVLSNKLGKDMLSNVLIIVSLNNGNDPEGANVLLENINDTEYSYEATVGATGQVQFPEVWKGNYDLTVSKNDYVPYENEVNIVETYFIKEVTLGEDLMSPVNLTVTTECNSVLVEWEAPESGLLLGYNFYKNGEQLNEEPLTDAFYSEMDLPGGTYEYEVTGVYATGESPAAGPVTVDILDYATPENLAATSVSFNNVELIWDEVTAEEFEGYRLFRNGEQLNEELLQTEFYIDYDVNFPAVYNYGVIAEYADGCFSDTSNIVTVSFNTGLENGDSQKVNIYPNPAKDYVMIDIIDNIEQVRIVNQLGQEVYSKSITDEDILRIEGLDAGTYISKLQTKKGEIITRRFVIVR